MPKKESSEAHVSWIASEGGIFEARVDSRCLMKSLAALR